MIVRTFPNLLLLHVLPPSTTRTSRPDSTELTCQCIQHDAVLDYYGRRLATCSSDKTIKIFEVEGETHRLTETLKGSVYPPHPSPIRPNTNHPPTLQPRRRRLVRLMGQSPPLPPPLPSLPLLLNPPLTPPTGPPQIRQHPRLILLRRQSANLARTNRALDQSLRIRPAHRLREHRILVAARERLPPRLRLVRRQRQRARVQGQQLGAPDLPRARHRRQRRQLGACDGPGQSGRCRAAGGGGRKKEVRDGRERLFG